LTLEARILTSKANGNGMAIHKKGQSGTSQWSYSIYLTSDTIGGFQITTSIIFGKMLNGQSLKHKKVDRVPGS